MRRPRGADECGKAEIRMNPINPWRELEPDVFQFEDSCRVYAVRGTGGAWLIVNAGTGAAVAALPLLGEVRAVTVLLTHHFRDHAAGAAQFRAAGARVGAPHWEREHLAGEQRAFRSKQIHLLYDTMWDHFAPIAPLTVDRWMMDYETATLAGLACEVIPTPGVTLGAVTYLVTLRGGRRIAFVGELMGEPGRLARFSPLQYNYNDLTGAENILLSWDRLIAVSPDAAYPSLGSRIDDCRAAAAQLREKVARFDQVQPGVATRLNAPSSGGIEEVCPRLYRALEVSAETHFIVGRTGRVLALDYGYDLAGIRVPPRVDFWTKRTLLHSVAALQRVTGARRIDTVLASHYHDDHVAGVCLLQRLFGTELWAGENFADLLAHPQDYDRPCLWPEPMQVTRRLPLGQKVHWEDVAITLYPMTGHTEFSTLICLELDGRRIAHTGDQLFFLDEKTGRLTGPEGPGGVFTNHVYRNGLALGGYLDCVRQLKAFDPEIVLSGHWKPWRPTPDTWRKLEAAAMAFDEVHRDILSLGADDVHFGAEGQAAKLQPHQLSLCRAQTAALRGWVLNPFNRPATARLEFATPPAGWSAVPVDLPLPPRAKVWFETTLTVSGDALCGRHPIALELTVDDRRFGQVAESWVTVT